MIHRPDDIDMHARSPLQPERPAYRPDIDGLRAIAVMSVVLCHAKLGFSGGFVGVDVFFVISGFLITGLIIRDLKRGSFSMFSFWERRVRRILPALIVVAVATFAVAWFLLFPSELRAFGSTLATLAVGSSNVQLWREAGYFDTSAQYKLLLHTWSLAVEEQFYLVTPLLLWLLFRRDGLRWIRVALYVCTAGSVALSIAGAEWFPSFNFYMLPTRAWELSLGSILAITPPLAGRRARQFVAAAGTLAILVPCVLYDDRTPFPGLTALPVALGAAGIIWAGSLRAQEQTWVGRLLEVRLLVGVGLISYSLYLWHWPMLVLGHHFGELSLAERLVIVAASIGLAVLSWRFIERPFRERTLLPRRKPLFAAAVVGLVVLVGAGMALRVTDGAPSRFSGSDLRFLDMTKVDPRYIHEVRLEDIAQSLPRLGATAEPPRMLVWGDSHAMAYLPAIDSAARAVGASALVATHTANPPVTDFDFYVPNGFNQNARPFNKAVLERALRGDIDVVVLSGKWGLYAQDERFVPRLHQTIDALRQRGIRVVFVVDVPRFSFYVPQRLFVAERFTSSLGTATLDARALQRQRQPQEDIIASLRDKDVAVIDTWDAFPGASTDGSFLPGDAGGSFYRDDDHLNTYGAMRLTPVFESAFRDLKSPTTGPAGHD